ncbi:MarR family transcriptional regulator [Sphingobium sp. PAMC28499]|uniref:MarR family transcriptional regulator n=1 Tax=unclassified Sphingobium TaxID=2611147 RepID=UPI000F094760|nr:MULTISPECIES: MarR family transcriptional regulator [unclassified Sphingobium]QCB37291.1 MarR family transcriptional regulator [Sphingobium sp. PAMC28499]
MTDQPRKALRPGNMAAPGKPARMLAGTKRRRVPRAPTPLEDEKGARFIRSIGEMRRRRADHAALVQSAEPAWDIMLDIYACALERIDLSVTAVGIAAGIAPATAQRWIKKLAALGVIERLADPRDRRRKLVRLSPAALAAMHHWQTEARAILEQIVRREEPS